MRKKAFLSAFLITIIVSVLALVGCVHFGTAHRGPNVTGIIYSGNTSTQVSDPYSLKGNVSAKANSDPSVSLQYPQNAVWIVNQDWVYMQPNILDNNLTKVLNDCSQNKIEYVFLYVGSWEAAYTIDYLESNATYAEVIADFHALNITVLAWVEDVDWIPDYHAGNWTHIDNAYLGVTQRGFDGINDDIERVVDGENTSDFINYCNNETVYMHSLGKLFMPDVACDWNQDINPYLHVDAIVSMFYGDESAFESSQAAAFWQENIGEYGQNTPPASPMILGIMNFDGNKYPLSWQLEQCSTLMSKYPCAKIEGFSLWLYEYMGTHPDDWSQWNYWITNNATATLSPTPTSPQFPWLIILPLFAVVILLSIVFARKIISKR